MQQLFSNGILLPAASEKFDVIRTDVGAPLLLVMHIVYIVNYLCLIFFSTFKVSNKNNLIKDNCFHCRIHQSRDAVVKVTLCQILFCWSNFFLMASNFTFLQ